MAFASATCDLVKDASRSFRTKSGSASNRGCLGIGGRSPLSPEIVKLFLNLRSPPFTVPLYWRYSGRRIESNPTATLKPSPTCMARRMCGPLDCTRRSNGRRIS